MKYLSQTLKLANSFQEKTSSPEDEPSLSHSLKQGDTFIVKSTLQLPGTFSKSKQKPYSLYPNVIFNIEDIAPNGQQLLNVSGFYTPILTDISSLTHHLINVNEWMQQLSHLLSASLKFNINEATLLLPDETTLHISISKEDKDLIFNTYISFPDERENYSVSPAFKKDFSSPQQFAEIIFDAINPEEDGFEEE